MTATHKPVALVTGASSGIGEAVAHTLSNAGYRVFATSRRALATTDSSGTEHLQLDVDSDTSVAAAISELIQRAGRIDLVVNSAGIGIVAAAEESSSEQTQAIFNTNVFGTIRVIRAVLPQMRAQGEGRIINVSSILGVIPAPFQAVYAASKHAVEGYSESLDHEVRQLGIRVSLIEPAYTKTGFDQHLITADAQLGAYTAGRQTAQTAFAQGMKQAVDVDVVARTVLAAAKDRKPELRYPAGKFAKRVSTLRRYAPVAIFDGGIRKSNGLIKRPRTRRAA
jgi:NAD(P)-dependent dehydrogenase (short-subunit alcohol dehydrogenase family)